MIIELEFEDFRERANKQGSQKFFWELSDRFEVVMSSGPFILRTTIFSMNEDIRLNFLEDAVEAKGYYMSLSEKMIRPKVVEATVIPEPVFDDNIGVFN